MRPRSQSGVSLLELLVAVAISSLILALGVPPLVRAAGGVALRLAAQEVATCFMTARAYALRHAARAGVKFRVDADGGVTWRLYRDGDGDGVLTEDIESGVDPSAAPAQRLAHFGRTIRFGFPPGMPPRDPSDPRRRLDRLEDPIRFNRSNIASFTAFDGSTPGSVYLTDGAGRLLAVRVAAATGRTRILTYEPSSERWR
jgi:prepilin-type N-terminal cleavage/methylation domain-containing protein